jgi:hypothetical protein
MINTNSWKVGGSVLAANTLAHLDQLQIEAVITVVV